MGSWRRYLSVAAQSGAIALRYLQVQSDAIGAIRCNCNQVQSGAIRRVLVHVGRGARGELIAFALRCNQVQSDGSSYMSVEAREVS